MKRRRSEIITQSSELIEKFTPYLSIYKEIREPTLKAKEVTGLSRK
jgi:hypothetical protein